MGRRYSKIIWPRIQTGTSLCFHNISCNFFMKRIFRNIIDYDYFYSHIFYKEIEKDGVCVYVKAAHLGRFLFSSSWKSGYFYKILILENM